MKLVTYLQDGRELVGVLTPDAAMVCPLNAFGYACTDMVEAIGMLSREEVQKLSARLAAGEAPEAVSLGAVKLLAPIPRPRQDVVCLGVNYAAHALECGSIGDFSAPRETQPAIYFAKRVNRAVDPDEPVDSHPGLVEELDYEAELAVILGKDALNVAKDDCEQYIFGYTILNDISARVLQRRHKQWYRGKSLDNFTPIGPWIVTADEFAFPPRLHIGCRVNGELRQNSTTEYLIHGVEDILTELSEGMTLQAGTIIATGTPSGVAMGMEQPVYLKPGDVVECFIEGIGTLRNPVK